MLNRHNLTIHKKCDNYLTLIKPDKYAIIIDTNDNDKVKAFLITDISIIDNLRLINTINEWIYYKVDDINPMPDYITIAKPELLSINVFNKYLNALLAYEINELIDNKVNYLIQVSYIKDNVLTSLPKPAKWSINGQLRMFKRLHTLKLPIKHGLYTYNYLDNSNYMCFSKG